MPSDTICANKDYPTQLDITNGMSRFRGLKCMLYLSQSGDPILGCGNSALLHWKLPYEYLKWIADEAQRLILSLATHDRGIDLKDFPLGVVRDLTLVEQSSRFGDSGFPERDFADGRFSKRSAWHPGSELHNRSIDYRTDARGRDAVSRGNTELVAPAVCGISDLAHVQDFLQKCGAMTDV